MWLDGATERKWAQALDFSGESKVVLLNPGKRKRFAVHDGTLTFEAM